MERESAVVGMPAADACPARFPDNIIASEVMTLDDIQAIAGLVVPKGQLTPLFEAKAWLPANEELAMQLGYAQQAMRLLDDQRAIVSDVCIFKDLVVIDLARAPAANSVEWRTVPVMPEVFEPCVTADLIGAHGSVLVRWPLLSGLAA